MFIYGYRTTFPPFPQDIRSINYRKKIKAIKTKKAEDGALVRNHEKRNSNIFSRYQLPTPRVSEPGKIRVFFGKT